MQVYKEFDRYTIFNKYINTNNFYPFQYFKLFSKIIGI